jgi:hypothetical protein
MTHERNKKQLFRNARERAEFGAIVSFENPEGLTLTIALTDMPPSKAIRRTCKMAIAYDETFRVVAISTPSTIYTDVKGERIIRKGQGHVPEGSLLGAVGMGHLLHEKLKKGKWTR